MHTYCTIDSQDRMRMNALSTYMNSMQQFIDLHDLKAWLGFTKVLIQYLCVRVCIYLHMYFCVHAFHVRV
jgi:hypothetical protein